MLVQPFANRNFADGWYAVSAPIVTANWEASSSDTWTVPVGGSFGKVFKIGSQPISTSLQAYYNVEKPEWPGLVAPVPDEVPVPEVRGLPAA